LGMRAGPFGGPINKPCLIDCHCEYFPLRFTEILKRIQWNQNIFRLFLDSVKLNLRKYQLILLN